MEKEGVEGTDKDKAEGSWSLFFPPYCMSKSDRLCSALGPPLSKRSQASFQRSRGHMVPEQYTEPNITYHCAK